MNAERLTEAQAKERVRYGLAFTHAPRDLHYEGMGGPDLPNSWHHLRLARHEVMDRWQQEQTTGSGDWDTGGEHAADWNGDENTATLDAWVRFWLGIAVAEALHEVCEWFWLDGAMLLDPHHGAELDLHRAAAAAADILARALSAGEAS